MPGQPFIEEIAYNAAVHGFGSRIRVVRQRRKLKMTQVAREALGIDASKIDVRDFANYLSKVELEHPEARNPSLDLLEQIAAGLKLTKLSDFFAQLETAPIESGRDSQDSSLQSDKSVRDTAVSPSGEAASHGVGSLSAAAADTAALRQLRADLRKFEADLGRLEARHRSRAAARRKKAPAREGVRARRKKAS